MSNLIHREFERSAQQYPEHIAVWAQDEVISYAELDQRSSALASWLLNNNFAPRERTAFMLPKSIDAIVAILGILKAGNAYVPIGINWPQRRTDSIFMNGDIKVLISQSSTNIGSSAIDKILHVDTDEWRSVSKNTTATATSPDTNIQQHDLAYILYTSGSTGVPKGVCISHEAAYYFPEWAKDEFTVNNMDRIASIAPFTFDLSTFDLFTGLSAGTTIYLVPENCKLLPTHLSRFLQDHGITIIYAVPSTLSLLASRGQLNNRDLQQLRCILFAGEVFPPPLYLQFKQLMPEHIEYYNLYGPTETNVCTYYKMPTDFNGGTPIPIGQALPGTHTFLINDDNEIIDNSDPGELCVTGPGVMSGYWGDTNNKNQHYWVNCGENSPRGYKTGDIVELGKTGDWNYKGRRDSMVKIWGYRVELGEIESCLLMHDDVEFSAVVKHDVEGRLGEELVAFIVTSQGNNNDPDMNDIYKHCKHNLPHFMVPNKIYAISDLPINNSGKIDRLQLETLASSYSQ